MKTAVLIHGFHVDSRLSAPEGEISWHDLVIGPEYPWFNQGRATYGVFLAYEESAEAVIFSTGASERDGLKEAEYTHRKFMEASSAFSESVLRIDGERLRAWLEPRVRFDVESRTTEEELRKNLTWCYEMEFWRVFLVTNRFHAPRTRANACRVREELRLTHLRIHVSAPNDASPAPVIFEPPTRPDRASTDFRPTLSRVFGIPADRQEEACAEIDALLDRYTR